MWMIDLLNEMKIMSIIYYEGEVSTANEYGYDAGGKLTATVVKYEYDKTGKLIKKSIIRNIKVGVYFLSEEQAKMLYIALSDNAEELPL